MTKLIKSLLFSVAYGMPQQAQFNNQACGVYRSAECSFTSGTGEDGVGTVSGSLMLRQYDQCQGGTSGPVMVQGDLSGSSANFVVGYHGLHVHANKDMPTCGDLGGHFAVGEDEIHGESSRYLPDRHAGDLGNILVSSTMSAMVNIEDHILSLDSNSIYYIGGRGMVLHALMDDGNPTRDPSSTGAAGARVACCLITESATDQNRQMPQTPNQVPQISNQQPQQSNQVAQVSNQQSQISFQECQVFARATCNFSTGEGEDGVGTVSGALSITHFNNCRGGEERVVFEGSIRGGSENFVDGLHGLHVHQGDDISSCGSLGGHFAVSPNAIHGRPSWMEPERHAGDLGNIRVSQGQSQVRMVDQIVSLDTNSAFSIAGRGMVLHALVDDFNPTRDSSSTGAAGARVGCCLIEAVTYA